MSEFDPAYQKMLYNEGGTRLDGGWNNNPDDPGGETVFGISRVHWPDWEGWAIVDELRSAPEFPRNLGREPRLVKSRRQFYLDHFWHARYAEIKTQELADELFDLGVNTSRGSAVRLLQEATRKFVTGPLVVDGLIGPRTVEAVNEVESMRLLSEYRARQIVHYCAVALGRLLRKLNDLGHVIPAKDVNEARRYALAFKLGWARRILA